MAGATTKDSSSTYHDLVATLLPDASALRPLILPQSSQPQADDASLTAAISSPQLHPALEAQLHILNNDLASAHFLVRHMQSPPAVEGMLLHAQLHRVEGDFDNTRAWLGDVWADDERGKPLMRAVYGGDDDDDGYAERESKALVDRIEAFRAAGGGRDEAELARLLDAVYEEIRGVLAWCEARFGTRRWEDASGEWVRPSEKIKQIGEEQVSGDKGFREF